MSGHLQYSMLKALCLILHADSVLGAARLPFLPSNHGLQLSTPDSRKCSFLSLYMKPEVAQVKYTSMFDQAPLGIQRGV